MYVSKNISINLWIWLSTQHSELDHQASEWTCEGLNKVQTDSPTIKNRWKWNHSTRKWSSQNPISKTQWNFYGLRSCLPVWMLGFFTSTGTLHYTWLADNTNKSQSLIASLTFWKKLGDLCKKDCDALIPMTRTFCPQECACAMGEFATPPGKFSARTTCHVSVMTSQGCIHETLRTPVNTSVAVFGFIWIPAVTMPWYTSPSKTRALNVSGLQKFEFSMHGEVKTLLLDVVWSLNLHHFRFNWDLCIQG